MDFSPPPAIVREAAFTTAQEELELMTTTEKNTGTCPNCPPCPFEHVKPNMPQSVPLPEGTPAGFSSTSPAAMLYEQDRVTRDWTLRVLTMLTIFTGINISPMVKAFVVAVVTGMTHTVAP